jgi:hypothetical protein
MTFQGSASLPANSAWSAELTVYDSRQQEVGRRAYAFALDATGVREGRSLPPIDPLLVTGLIVLVAGAAGLAMAASGRTLPRTSGAWSRAVLGAGSIVSLGLGILIVAGGELR